MSEYISSFRLGFIKLSPPLKLLLLVILLLVFALFGSLLAMIIAIPAYNYNLLELSKILSGPDEENIAVIKFFQIFQSVTLFIFPALAAAWLFSEKPVEYVYARRSPSVVTLVWVSLSIVVAIPFLNYITELNSRLDLPYWLDGIEQRMISMEETAARLTELFLKTGSTADLVINFVMIAILPALGEELLFRGIIQRLFAQWFRNGHVAVFTTAFLFSFIHFQFFGFVPRFLLGLYFGYLLFWSRSLWVPILAHLVNNGLAVIYYHYAGSSPVNTTIENIGIDDNTRYMLYVSIFFSAVLIAMIYMREKGKSAVDSNLL